MNDQPKTIVVSGGTGLVGRALCAALREKDRRYNLVVLSRTPDKYTLEGAKLVKSLDDLDNGTDLAGIVNLAGPSIADRRWTNSRKRELVNARVEYTRELLNSCRRRQWEPPVVVNASAIGYYGPRDDNPVDEASSYGKGFGAELCRRWEQSAEGFRELGSRLCIVRFGVILAPGGGALEKLLPIYRLGLGGPIGDGNQWFSWIHVNDVVGLIESCLFDRRKQGVFNVTAPEPVRQKMFAAELGRQLNRPVFMRTPAIILKMVYGQMAEELLISGQKVVPARALDSGYKFLFPTLEGALADVLGERGRV